MLAGKQAVATMKLVLTCEHGGNIIPREYASLFEDHQEVLKTHRGFDLGAFDLFEYLKPLSHVAHSSTTSRLLIELNRSLHHRNLFSEFSKKLSKENKDQLIQSYYLTYRHKIENQIMEFISSEEKVLHVSVHSFTPVLNEDVRNSDLSLLFDSRKTSEKQFCKDFKTSILKKNPEYRIKFNYPYLGKSDGFTSYLRKLFPKIYLGIKFKFNKKFLKNNKMNSKIKQKFYIVLECYSTGKLK